MTLELRSNGASVATLLASELRLEATSSGQPRTFAAGRGFPDSYLKQAPVVMIPVFGLVHADVDDLLRVLYRAQTMSMGFRPILYTDMNIFAAVRPYGWILEHHMSEYDFARTKSGGAWETSVLDHALGAVRFFDAQAVVVPDPTDGFRSLLRELRAVSGSEVGTALTPRSVVNVPVSGWRAWSSRRHKPGRAYALETFSADTITVALEGGTGENVLIADGSEFDASMETFINEAEARDWPIVRLDSLDDLDNIELPIALESLVSLADDDSTAVLLCSSHLSSRIRKLDISKRMLLWTTEASGTEPGNKPPVTMAQVDLKTTIRRASSALIRPL